MVAYACTHMIRRHDGSVSHIHHQKGLALEALGLPGGPNRAGHFADFHNFLPNFLLR
jgi:hypothetical protein